MRFGSTRTAVPRLAAATSSVLFGSLALLALFGTPPQTAPGDAAAVSGTAPAPAPPRLTLAPGAASGGLAVVAARPQGPASGAVRPTITFSKPVHVLSDAEAAAPARPPARLTPAVPGEWRWIGSASVEFVPAAPLPRATEFTVEVAAGLEAVDGSKLAEPYRFQFSTDRPTILAVDPEPAYRWVRPDQTFALTLDQPVRDIERRVRVRVDRGDGRWDDVGFTLAREVDVAREERERQKDLPAWRRWQEPDRGFADLRRRYELTPVRALPLASALEFVVDAELQAVAGPLTIEAGRRHGLRTYGPLKIEAVRRCPWGSGDGYMCPYGPVQVLFSNPVAPEALKDRLKFTPPVKLDWAAADAGVAWDRDGNPPLVSIPGDFAPGTSYTVELAAGVTDEFGQPAAAHRAVVKLGDVEPNLFVDRNEALIETAGDGALPMRTVNEPMVSAEVWALSPAEWARENGARWNAESGWPGRPRDLLRNAPTAARRNAWRWTPLPLRDALPAGRRNGLFFARLKGGAQQYDVLAQVTDLAVHAKLGATSSLVWVTRLSTGEPVRDAAIELYDNTGKVKAVATTDADGVASLPGLAGLVPARQWGGPTRVLVAAKKDGDVGVAVTDSQHDLNPWQLGVRGGWDGVEPIGLGFINPERGIYRPGDDVLLKGLVRFRNGGEIRTPRAGTKATLVVKDSRGQDVETLEVALSEFGTFSAKTTLPAGAALGSWYAGATVQLEGGKVDVGGGFRVEEYRAPQFRVDVDAPRSELVAGDPLSATVSARYLFGGAMPGAEVSWSVLRATTDFAPPQNPGFQFGVHTWGWDDDEPRLSSDVFASGKGQTDRAGNFSVTAEAVEAPAGRTWSYTAEAEVTDVSRQRIAGRATITVHPAGVYAGIKVAGEGFATAGRDLDVELVAAEPGGARRPGATLTLAVKRRTWNWIRKKESGSEWYTVAEPVETAIAECTRASAAEPVTCTFRPEEPGLYLLDATVTDEKGRRQTTKTSIYAIGSGWVSWQQDDTAKIDLIADRERYDVGDTAKVLVKSPWPQADGLVTIEREGIRSHRRVHFEGSASTIDVPIDDDMVPNVFVSVLLFRGRVTGAPAVEGDIDPGRPAVRAGCVELKIERKTRRLAVDVTVDASEKRPRETVTVDLHVKDSAGRGARTEVTVWAVDEGVLRLTGYQPPDPVDAVHPERDLSVRLADSVLTLLKKREYKEKGGTPVADAATGLGDLAEDALRWGGGGGLEGAEMRSRFKTTVLFAPDVVTDADGHARLTFELPDNLTTFRIMALAVDAKERFGLGGSKVTVSKPLLALPALPRFARTGDAFEAGIVAHGRDGRERDVEVTVAAEGLVLDGPASQKATLREGRPQEVRFRFRAEQAGTARLRFRVAGRGESDAVEQTFPVREPTALETVAAYGDTRDRRVEGIAPPSGVRPDAGGLELQLSSTAIGGYTEAVRQLVAYPYGCVEQLASRLVPFIELRTLQKAFGAADDEAGARASYEFYERWMPAEELKRIGGGPEEVVKASIEKIQQLQNPDGGFRYWSSDGCSAPYATTYATLALGRARAAGFEIDAAAFARAQQYLAERVVPGRGYLCNGWDRTADSATRVFGAWVLARTGAPLGSYYAELHGLRDRLPLFSRAMLVDAMLLSGPGAAGSDALAKAGFQELLGFARETAGEVHFQEVDLERQAEYWSSDARSTAIVMLVLADHVPDHPYVAKIARWLAGQRRQDGTYRNTQESAFTLMALTELLATKEKDVPDFTARVLLGGKELVKARFAGRSLDAQRTSAPMADLRAAGKKSPLTFSKDGTGVLYYSAALRYLPLRSDLEALDRGMVVQRWFEPWDARGQATKAFAAGALLRLRVRVATPAERNFVAIEVPLPAGLEAVDPSLATSARAPAPVRELLEEEGGGEPEDDVGPWAFRFWSPFNHRELRDDRVLVFADRLPAGVHEVDVTVRATTPGRFVLLPARAEEMYSPEVFGRSEGTTIEVVP